jgi:hypothetical protein
MERIFRAAKSVGSVLQIDLKTLVVTVLPAAKEGEPVDGLVPDGLESWDDFDVAKEFAEFENPRRKPNK